MLEPLGPDLWYADRVIVSFKSFDRRSKMVEGWGHPPIDYRLSFRRRGSARPEIRALIAWQPERVVVAHGEIVRRDGAAFLRRAFSWPLE